MRFYQQILLVVGLTTGMLAAGVAWERFYVSPLVEQAQRRPDSADSAADALSAECLEELATMGSTSTAMDLRPERSDGAKGAYGKSSQDESGSNLRQQSGANLATMHVQVTEPSEAPEAIEPDAAARPIQHAQSAEYSEPSLRPATGGREAQRSRGGTLAASAVDSIGLGDLHDPLKSVDVLDLMRRLRADDGDQRAEAGRELVRRGFSEVDLELARQLFSPDAETRKQLARAVPRLSSVDAAKWLMWLALDPQPDVRLAALTTLATTGDPALLDRVEAAARSDHDPQIQSLADQIARQRVLAASRGDQN